MQQLSPHQGNEVKLKAGENLLDRRWQGVEVEYALPIREEGWTDANRLMKYLQGDGDSRQNSSYLIPLRGGASNFLKNGGRGYIDHPAGHDLLELCTPECSSARELVAYERACDLVTAETCSRLGVHCYKSSITYSDKRKTSHAPRGLHESYLVREDHLSQLVECLIPFLVVRPLLCGTGGYYQGRYVLSPRQFFMRKIVSDKVTGDFPFIALGKRSNTGNGFARLHLCSGEGARCDGTTFLRNGVTAAIINCFEQGLIHSVPRIQDPVEEAQKISSNVSGNWVITLENGSRMDAVEFLREFYMDPIQRLAQKLGIARSDSLLLNLLEDTLDCLATSAITRLSRRLDWAVKLDVIELNGNEYFQLRQGTWEEKETLDFQFKSLTDSTFAELEAELPIERLTSEEEVRQAMVNPPPDSRAALRRELAEQFGVELEQLDWDSVTVRGRKYELLKLDGWNKETRTELMKHISFDMGGRPA